MNDEAVCRTAPATPGLSITLPTMWQTVQELISKANIAGQHNLCKVYIARWLTLGNMYNIDMNIVHIYHQEHNINYAIM